MHGEYKERYEESFFVSLLLNLTHSLGKVLFFSITKVLFLNKIGGYAQEEVPKTFSLIMFFLWII